MVGKMSQMRWLEVTQVYLVLKGVSTCPCGLALTSTCLRISSSLTEMFLMLPDLLMGASASSPTLLLKSAFPPEVYDIF